MIPQEIIYALLSMIPDPQSLEEFKQDCAKLKDGDNLYESLLNFVLNHHIIDKKNFGTLSQFIENNQLNLSKPIKKQFPKTFSELIDNTDRLLCVKTVFLLTEQINALADKFDILLNTHRSKFSLLKQTSHITPAKKNTLRALSFWVGYYRSNLINDYNFKNLLVLCKNQEETRKEVEVCRVAFSLHSRGDDINTKMVDWLKGKISSFINENINKHMNKPVRSDSITSCYVHFSKIQTSKNELINPASYSEYINNAIFLAYQIAIKWFLSTHGSKQIFLSIGIASGDHKNFDNHLKAIVEEKLPDDPVIRLTEYTRQCILMNEIRVVTCNQPKEIEISNREIVNVWWIVGLWNTIYWDYIYDLLNENILPFNDLINLLWNPEDEEIQSEKEEKNAVKIILKYPHNTLLGLEIAKTLYYRQKYLEANEIIRIILSRDPTNLIARSLRMDIFWNQGILSESYSKSYMYFRNAEEESNYIDEYCSIKDEDYYCECGLIKLAHALTVFRLLRKINGSYQNLDETLSKEDVINLLRQAELYFEKGMTCSPTGSRSLYLILCTRSFRRLITKNDIFFRTPDIMIIDNYDIFKKTGKELFHLMGWLRDDLSDSKKYSFFHKITEKALLVHSNSNFLTSFIPNALFCYAVLIWDFSPALTPAIIRQVIDWLYEARKISKQLFSDNLCIFSITRFNAEIMKANIFSEHITKVINEIEKRLEKTEVLKKNHNEWIEDNNDLGELKLCLINI